MMQRMSGLTVFQRLMLANVIVVVVAATGFGVVHQMHSVRDVASMIEAQIASEQAHATAYLESVYGAPLRGHLIVMAASTALDDLLSHTRSEEPYYRPRAERALLLNLDANPALAGCMYADADRSERLRLSRGRSEFHQMATQPAGDTCLNPREDAIFTRLARGRTGRVLLDVPQRDSDGRVTMLAAVSKSDPDTGEFGGVLFVKCDLTDWLARQRDCRIEGTPAAWVLTADGCVLLAPMESAARVDPRSIPCGHSAAGILRTVGWGSDLAGRPLILISYAVPRSLLTSAMVSPLYHELAVAACVTAVATLLAYVAARRISEPIKNLVRAVRSFPASAPQEVLPITASGEVGTLARAFADMTTTVGHTTTCLEQARSRAEAADRAKSQFLAHMSHEIRTPMTAILGFADELLEQALDDAQRNEAIQIIRRTGRHLLAIINDILDFSRIEAGQMTVEQSRCSLVTILAEVASLIQARAADRGLKFQLEYGTPLPETILSDPTRLLQILLNLASNAVKFTQTGGIRLVATLSEGDPPRLQFDVIDTGIGLTSEQCRRLFTPFVQADGSTARRFGGTGLGLVISKRFAQLLGGDVEIVASTAGRGTQFRVTVPTGPLDGVPRIASPSSGEEQGDDTVAADGPLAQAPLAGARILLAEDGPDNQRLIRRMLERAGADVEIVDDGRAAISAVLAAMQESRPFDVILMDMQMPKLDGYDATRRLRQQAYTGLIIALTAHALTTDREQCLTAGCDEYLTKPIDRRVFLGTLATLVRRPRSPEAALAP